MAKRWYIVHTYSNFEKKVAEAIREKAAATGLADKFEEILCPPRKWSRSGAGGRSTPNGNFFPDMCSSAWT
ncbi:MAG: hypothetical protein M5U16_17060 [Hyphomicrobium sp.]|nr:hypothetical protein [Hyphomicrobium sp.]